MMLNRGEEASAKSVERVEVSEEPVCKKGVENAELGCEVLRVRVGNKRLGAVTRAENRSPRGQPPFHVSASE